LIPLLRYHCGFLQGRFARRFCHDDSQPVVKMPIDVTVEKPRSRIIRRETDCNIVCSAAANGYHIAPDRVHKIRRIGAGDPYNVECVAMKMHRVRCTRSCSRIGEVYFDNLVQGELIDASIGQQLRGMSCPTEDLQKHGDRGRDIGYIVECEIPGRVGSCSELNGHIRLSNLGYPWRAWVDEWVEVALIE